MSSLSAALKDGVFIDASTAFSLSSDEENSRRNSDRTPTVERSRLLQILAISFLLAALIAVTACGAFIFLAIESTGEDAPFKHVCLKKQVKRVEGKISEDEAKRIFREIEECLFTERKINKSILVATVHAWSLYTTVGYGDTFPRNHLGWLAMAIYTIVTVPLYVALKAEVGNLICRAPASPPPDYLLLIIIVFFFALFMLLTSFIVMFFEHWSLWKSLYFVFSTISLVGLGDVVPSNLSVFLLKTPLYLIGDVLMNHINFYFQSRYRKGALCLASMTSNIIGVAVEEEERRYVAVEYHPNVATNAIPTGIMSCERTQREVTSRHPSASRLSLCRSRPLTAIQSRSALCETQRDCSRNEMDRLDNDDSTQLLNHTIAPTHRTQSSSLKILSPLWRLHHQAESPSSSATQSSQSLR
ncbi:hypothetical protein Q1695_007311 [Nippostrongylus brasiliensis]|nr:hypothetical protein Q1695_007311 [Nippostrongylus brasiliensis]